MPAIDVKITASTKEELFNNLPDNVLLVLLENWIPPEFKFTDELKLECFKELNYKKVFSLEPIGTDDSYSHQKHIVTSIPSSGLKTRRIHSGGRNYENHEFVRGPGVLFVSRYAHLEQPKVIRKALYLKFPFLINFDPEIFSITNIDDQIYLNLSGKSVYVPIRAIVEKNRELIINACKKAHAFWPKADIWNGEFSTSGTEEIARFLDILES
jgi:hypothetical protein